MCGLRSGNTFMAINLKDQWGSTVVAFRGYNVGNRGRSAELLRHPQYGPVVKKLLREASAICSQASGQKTDLVRRVRGGSKTRLGNFAQDGFRDRCREGIAAEGATLFAQGKTSNLLFCQHC